MPAIVIPLLLGLLPALGSIAVRLLGKGAALLVKIEVYFWALIYISTGLSHVAYAALYWALHPDTIELSYTKLTNPIIKIGFGITSSLVNMALVLVLIYVALVIALRLTKEVEAQKMLVKFILVALLVNFAPVLCGLVVDAANIIMHEFTKRLLESPTAPFHFFIKSADAVAELGFITPADFALATWVIIFNFLLALVFFLFAGIIILRHLAIWVLVILAPLAFVCAITPLTHKYWVLWRDQFFKWSFIGVTIVFFLFLALYFTTTVEGHVRPIGDLEKPSLGGLLIYSIPLVFLYLAFQMGIKSGAWGAAALVGFSIPLIKKGAMWVQRKGKEKIGWGITRATDWATKGARERLEAEKRERFAQAAQAIEEQAFLSPPTKEEWKTSKKAAAKKAIKWAIGRTFGRVAASMLEKERKRIVEAEKEVEGERLETIGIKFKRTPFITDRIGYLDYLAKEGKIDDALEEGIITSEELIETLKAARFYDRHKDLFAAAPHLDIEYITQLAQKEGVDISEMYKRELKKILPSRAGQLSLAALTDETLINGRKLGEIIAEAVLQWDNRQMANLFEKQGERAVKIIEDRMKALMAENNLNPNDFDDVNKFFEEVIKNPKLNRWRLTAAGRSVFSFPVRPPKKEKVSKKTKSEE